MTERDEGSGTRSVHPSTHAEALKIDQVHTDGNVVSLF